MKEKPVIVVDDEKNIRLTLCQTLESLGLETDTAANGEEALERLKMKEFGLILLDLKMPGMDGMEVLRQLREIRPDIRVIIITAYGTVESAVEAMKLGAVDFIEKPFAPGEIRELVLKVLDRERLEEQKAADYTSHIELAKRCVTNRHFDAAIEHARQAIALDHSRPEAFNLLGALMEIRHNVLEAHKYYRAALELDPTYRPAIDNLNRSTKSHRGGGIVLDQTVDNEKNKKEEDWLPAKQRLSVIIVGCGLLGSYLANRLGHDGHSAVVIDLEESSLCPLDGQEGKQIELLRI